MKTSNPTLILPFFSLYTEIDTQQLYLNLLFFLFQSEETSGEQKKKEEPKKAPKESLKSKC